jgi:hypothetical protein
MYFIVHCSILRQIFSLRQKLFNLASLYVCRDGVHFSLPASMMTALNASRLVAIACSEACFPISGTGAYSLYSSRIN